jgi:hypothetical protein
MRKLQVFSSTKNLDGGPKQYHGCFEAAEADRFMTAGKKEHPNKLWESDECSHPEHF